MKGEFSSLHSEITEKPRSWEGGLHIFAYLLTTFRKINQYVAWKLSEATGIRYFLKLP